MLSILGARLQVVRKSRGWSREEVAIKTKLSASWIFKLETGDLANPSLTSIMKLAKLYRVDLNELMATVHTDPDADLLMRFSRPPGIDEITPDDLATVRTAMQGVLNAILEERHKTAGHGSDESGKKN